VDSGQLSPSRYALYLRVLQELLGESSVKV
jgi:hypothetical protein